MDFDNAFEKIKKGLKDSAALSIEKIEEYTKIGKLKIEEFSAKRKIERNYIDIGERVFELISEEKGNEIEKDIIVSNAIDNVNNLKEELIEIEKNIEKVADESKEKNTAADDEVTGM